MHYTGTIADEQRDAAFPDTATPIHVLSSSVGIERYLTTPSFPCLFLPGPVLGVGETGEHACRLELQARTHFSRSPLGALAFLLPWLAVRWSSSVRQQCARSFRRPTDDPPLFSRSREITCNYRLRNHLSRGAARHTGAWRCVIKFIAEFSDYTRAVPPPLSIYRTLIFNFFSCLPVTVLVPAQMLNKNATR